MWLRRCLRVEILFAKRCLLQANGLLFHRILIPILLECLANPGQKATNRNRPDVSLLLITLRLRSWKSIVFQVTVTKTVSYRILPSHSDDHLARKPDIVIARTWWTCCWWIRSWSLVVIQYFSKRCSFFLLFQHVFLLRWSPTWLSPQPLTFSRQLVTSALLFSVIPTGGKGKGQTELVFFLQIS